MRDCVDGYSTVRDVGASNPVAVSAGRGRGIDRSVMHGPLEGLHRTEQILTRRIEALAALPQRALLLGVDFMHTDPKNALGFTQPELHRRALKRDRGRGPVAAVGLPGRQPT